MGNLNDLNQIKSVLSKLDELRPANFGYTEAAVEATGAAEVTALTGVYIDDDSSEINSIPAPELIAMDPIVQSIGLRTQAATITRMMLNHFFGRLGLNLLKLTEKVKLLVDEHLVNRYITPSGKIVESISITAQASIVQITQNQSLLSASAPVSEPTVLTFPAAVHDSAAGVMTGADKAILDDLNTEAVRLLGNQTILGIKTFNSIPVLPASDPASDNQAARKAYVDAQIAAHDSQHEDAFVGLTGNQTVAGIKTFSSLPVLPDSDPSANNEAARKLYVDTVRLNAQTGTTYTFNLTDTGKLVTFNNAAAVTVTIPQNSSIAFPIGTQIDLVQIGAGKVTLGGTGVTINSKNSNKSLSAQWAAATLIKTATDTWVLVGDLAA